MTSPLSNRDKLLIKLAEKGGVDKDLVLFDALFELDDKIHALEDLVRRIETLKTEPLDLKETNKILLELIQELRRQKDVSVKINLI